MPRCPRCGCPYRHDCRSPLNPADCPVGQMPPDAATARRWDQYRKREAAAIVMLGGGPGKYSDRDLNRIWAEALEFEPFLADMLFMRGTSRKPRVNSKDSPATAASKNAAARRDNAERAKAWDPDLDSQNPLDYRPCPVCEGPLPARKQLCSDECREITKRLRDESRDLVGAPS